MNGIVRSFLYLGALIMEWRMEMTPRDREALRRQLASGKWVSKKFGDLRRFIQPAEGVVILGNPTPAQLREHQEEVERNMAGVHTAIRLLCDRPKSDAVLKRLCGMRERIETYDFLQGKLFETNVRTDRTYQTRFKGFYVMGRKKQAWYDCYFALLERAKHELVSFVNVLDAMRRIDGKWHSSFASKLVATIHPEEPVLDSKVREALRLPMPKPDRQSHINTYNEVCRRRKIETASAYGDDWVARFNAALPAFKHFTATKKLDLFLWQWRL